MSDFLQMNLNNLSGIRNTNARIAAAQNRRNEIGSQNMYNAFKSGADAFSNYNSAEKQRAFSSGEAEKNRQELNQFKIDAEDRINKAYNDGKYYDPVTGKSYAWDNPQQFDLAKESMKRANDIYYALHFGLGKDKEKGPRDLSSAFFGMLGEMATTDFPDSFDRSKQRYTWNWNDENKQKMRDAFNNLLYGYSNSEKANLKKRLDTFLAQRSYEAPTPGSATGGKGNQFWKNFGYGLSGKDQYGNDVYGKAEGPLAGIVNTFGKVINSFKGSGQKLNNMEQDIRASAPTSDELYASRLQAGESNRKAGLLKENDIQSDSDIQSLAGSILDTNSMLPANTSKWNMMESILKRLKPLNAMSDGEKRFLTRYLLDAQDGDMNRGTLNNFISFLKKMEN